MQSLHQIANVQAMWGGSGGDAGNCACDLPANDNAYRLDVSQVRAACKRFR